MNSKKDYLFYIDEKDYGYELVYVTLEAAMHNNEQIADISEIPWVKRDTKVMHYLMKEY